ncbi:hypothetical protein ACFXKO_34055, partial [Streptomyces sp. NPDC059209]
MSTGTCAGPKSADGSTPRGALAAISGLPPPGDPASSGRAEKGGKSQRLEPGAPRVRPPPSSARPLARRVAGRADIPAVRRARLPYP